MREKLFWKLVALADKAQDSAFSRRAIWWQRTWVSIANRIDGLAGVVMTDEMRNRPAKAADRPGC